VIQSLRNDLAFVNESKSEAMHHFTQIQADFEQKNEVNRQQQAAQNELIEQKNFEIQRLVNEINEKQTLVNSLEVTSRQLEVDLNNLADLQQQALSEKANLEQRVIDLTTECDNLSKSTSLNIDYSLV
jgi:chromosome segregation ATPase